MEEVSNILFVKKWFFILKKFYKIVFSHVPSLSFSLKLWKRGSHDETSKCGKSYPCTTEGDQNRGREIFDVLFMIGVATFLGY